MVKRLKQNFPQEELDQYLQDLEDAKARHELSFIEVMSSIGARDDLGRPTTTPRQNRDALMKFIQES